MSLRKRALAAHHEQQAQDSSRELSAFLKGVLGLEVPHIYILKGPGGKLIAVGIEDDLAFCVYGHVLRVIHARTGEPYPPRAEWTPIPTLADLGRWLEKVEGSAAADPTDKVVNA